MKPVAKLDDEATHNGEHSRYQQIRCAMSAPDHSHLVHMDYGFEAPSYVTVTDR
jgi:hypothetical protein